MVLVATTGVENRTCAYGGGSGHPGSEAHLFVADSTEGDGLRAIGLPGLCGVAA
ncbi:hypothetical protein ACFC1R_19060 [Kitasatospora sp. NPDC056138]|uniref:hypothetical protein n=1 Tax=Kitasatospora sp. NPDC056138 TaxID=3345724 RepID=UPI0035D6A8FC